MEWRRSEAPLPVLLSDKTHSRTTKDGTAPKPSNSLHRASVDKFVDVKTIARIQGARDPGVCQKNEVAAAVESTPSPPALSSDAFVAASGYTPPRPIPKKNLQAMMVL